MKVEVVVLPLLLVVRDGEVGESSRNEECLVSL